MTATIEPERILREMNQLWDQTGADTGGAGVLRACTMTLIVVAENDEDAALARRTIGSIMHDHPSRALVVKTQDGEDMSARVFSECWMPFGGQQQICSEGVELTSGPRHFAEVARALVPLRAPDLPTVVWCRGPGAFTLRAFDELFPLADKIILDSSTISGASAALAFIRSLRLRGYRIADLEWTRLTGWREVLSQVFDDQSMQAPNSITSIRIAHGGQTPPICAIYFGSWLGRALPSAHVRFDTAEGDPGLRSVTLSSREGDLSLSVSSGGCLAVTGLGRQYRTALPPRDEAALMREELKILGSDSVYERVLG
ncbi:MAG: glucose-6-phosphate dehydrogenase assembly protein OpcA [Bryobacterales bacterium]|nr:glucose-6-phosphate dehydrogenase assembly protein OpcA [Bryobacterales bacterium]MBV9399010.1 glucose-6-phosphate dehydrogenase assembly protein OpcA [Bryobacterales bacterium]